jgi:hypothetical protein
MESYRALGWLAVAQPQYYEQGGRNRLDDVRGIAYAGGTAESGSSGSIQKGSIDGTHRDRHEQMNRCGFSIELG